MPNKKSEIATDVNEKNDLKAKIISIPKKESHSKKVKRLVKEKKLKRLESIRTSIGLSDSVFVSSDEPTNLKPMSEVRHEGDQRYIRIAVISREATHSFAKKYQSTARQRTSFRTSESSDLSLSASSNSSDGEKYSAMKAGEQYLVNQHLSNSKSIPAAIDEKGFIESVQLQLEGKATPHIIGVLEGHIAPDEMVIKNYDHEYRFIKVEYFDGLNSLGQVDHKQSMSAYIREDYLAYFGVSTLEVEVSEQGGKLDVAIGLDQKIPSNDADSDEKRVLLKHKCLMTKYKIDDQVYCNVIVHIPNEYANDQEAVNNAMIAVKQKLKIEHNINMIGYHGDTNFSSLGMSGTSPTVHGQTENSSVMKTSSGAKNMTVFMQNNTLAEYEGARAAYGTATQNVVTTKNKSKEGAGVGIDHPSFILWVELLKELQPYYSLDTSMAVDDEPPLPESKDKPSSLVLSSGPDTPFYSYSTDGSDKEFNSDVMSVG
ncbi:hypothetical protein L3V83_04995 [Thiotrichales bacterium 19X7-9]|nr:hypothetical protein [Thiotrichales bacterium 19X7-9]